MSDDQSRALYLSKKLANPELPQQTHHLVIRIEDICLQQARLRKHEGMELSIYWKEITNGRMSSMVHHSNFTVVGPFFQARRNF